MRQVTGDDVIHRTLDTAIRCGYRLIGELVEVWAGKWVDGMVKLAVRTLAVNQLVIGLFCPVFLLS